MTDHDTTRPRNVRPLTNTKRQTPQDLDAEARIITAVLDRGHHILPDLGNLRPDTFAWPSHQTIYAAALNLAGTGRPIHPISVVDELRRQGVLDQINTPDGLLQGAQAVHAGWDHTGITTNVAQDLANIVVRCKRGRELIAAGDRIRDAGYAADIDSALPAIEDATTCLAGAELAHTSWQFVDLPDLLDGGLQVPPPVILDRGDGHCLLYAGKIHAFNAESESGKSWLAIVACIECMRRGEHVIYLDFEDDATGVTARFVELGCDHGLLTEYLHYARIDDPLGAASRALIDHAAQTWQPALAIVDGVTEVMVQNGWSIKDNDDIANFLAALPRVLERHGATVVLIDHVTKDKETRGRFAIGGQHKLAGISGAAYRLEILKPFGRGRDGLAKVLVTKDKGGHVRSLPNEHSDIVSMFHLRTLTNGRLAAQLQPPDPTTERDRFRPDGLMQDVSEYIEKANAIGVNPTAGSIKNDVHGSSRFIVAALQLLLKEDYVELVSGARKDATYYHSRRPFRSQDNPVDGTPDFNEEPF